MTSVTVALSKVDRAGILTCMTRLHTSRSLVALMAYLVVLVTAVAACTEDKAGDSSSGTGGSKTAVSITGFGVNGLSDAGEYRVTTGGDDRPGQSWMKPASPVFAVEPSGPLSAPVTATIDLNAKADTGELVFIGTRESLEQPWTYLPATVSANGTAASATVNLRLSCGCG